QQLVTGDVHGYAEPVTLFVPPRALFAGLLKYEAADGQNVPRCFSDRNEHERRHQAARRMLPAQQRLDRTDVVADQTHDRLVVKVELAAVESAAEIVFEGQPIADLGTELTGEWHRSIAAGFLGGIHGDVRRSHQVFAG